MKMHMSGSVVHMEGNWTMDGLSRSNLGSLASALQQIEPGSANILRIDCEYVSSIDITGLQLLDVWLRCARLRGATPELVNTPLNMTKYFKLRDSDTQAVSVRTGQNTKMRFHKAREEKRK